MALADTCVDGWFDRDACSGAPDERAGEEGGSRSTADGGNVLYH